MRHQFGTALAEVGAELAVHAAVGTPMCPVCTTALPSGAQTCLRCGHPLSVGSTPNSMAALSYVPVQPRTTSTIRPMSASTDIARSDLQPEPQSNGDRPGLAMLAPDGSVARMVCLDSDRVDIGRTAGEIILPDDTYLSDRHARFCVGRRGNVTATTVQDLDSLNGVFLQIGELAELRDGDRFLVGLQLLKFELEPSDAPAGHPIRVSGCSLFGSAASPRYARLTEMTNDGIPRSVFVIGRDETILGREVGDIVFTDDPFMSRRHAALTRNPKSGGFALRDLGSSNGTFLRVRGKVELKAGDHLRIGQQLFRYDMIYVQA